MRKTRFFASLLMFLALMTACAPAAQEEAILTVGDKGYTRSELEALGTQSVDYTDKDGEITTYEGVPLAALLNDAGVTSDTLIFTAADDYQADMAAEEALSCENCIVAFDGDGLRLVMPDFSGKLQVKDLVSITAE
jgi:hypothetical protein